MTTKEEKKQPKSVVQVIKDAAQHLLNWLKKHGGATSNVGHVTPPVSQPPPVVPPVVTPSAFQAGDLVFLIHDLVPRNGVNGLPETHKCSPDAFYIVTAELYALIYAVNKLLNPDMSASEFVRQLGGAFRDNAGFSNQHGIDKYPADFRIESLDCGGATRRVVDGTPTRIGGDMYIKVQALDPANLPPVPMSLDAIDMCLWTMPTTALRGASNAFPNFGGRFLVPFLGAGGFNYEHIMNDKVAGQQLLKKVSVVQQPHLPARPDLTAGIIP